jgi:hypothetical protein
MLAIQNRLKKFPKGLRMETIGLLFYPRFNPLMAKKKRLKRQGRVVESINRSCLRCDHEFVAKNRFNRLCRNCGDLIRRFYDVPEETSLPWNTTAAASRRSHDGEEPR